MIYNFLIQNQKIDLQSEALERSTTNLKDMINMIKGQFENRLDIVNVYDMRFSKFDREILKTKELVHAFRDNQAAEINDERLRINKIE